MKKALRTTLDASAERFGTIIFSGGRIGVQVEVAPADLARLVRFQTADVTTDLIHR